MRFTHRIFPHDRIHFPLAQFLLRLPLQVAKNITGLFGYTIYGPKKKNDFVLLKGGHGLFNVLHTQLCVVCIPR